ncbi:hypothetical protein GCM10023238_07580 [Streptomyces heliomycini]
MAVPPMVGVPEAGGYVFYSGSRELFEHAHVGDAERVLDSGTRPTVGADTRCYRGLTI